MAYQLVVSQLIRFVDIEILILEDVRIDPEQQQNNKQNHDHQSSSVRVLEIGSVLFCMPSRFRWDAIFPFFVNFFQFSQSHKHICGTTHVKIILYRFKLVVSGNWIVFRRHPNWTTDITPNKDEIIAR